MLMWAEDDAALHIFDTFSLQQHHDQSHDSESRHWPPNSFPSMLLVFRVQCVDVSMRRTSLSGRLAEWFQGDVVNTWKLWEPRLPETQNRENWSVGEHKWVIVRVCRMCWQDELNQWVVLSLTVSACDNCDVWHGRWHISFHGSSAAEYRTVILLNPRQGCFGSKWNVCRQNAARFILLICSTGFGRQLEGAPADETKSCFCSLCWCEQGLRCMGWWVRPWGEKCLIQVFITSWANSLKDQQTHVLLKCLFFTNFLFFTSHILMDRNFTVTAEPDSYQQSNTFPKASDKQRRAAYLLRHTSCSV